MRPFIFFIAAILLISCSDQPATLRAGMVTWPGYEPVILARDLGFLGKDVVINRTLSSNDVVEAFKRDLIDIAFLTLDETITYLHQTTEKIKIIAITDISNGADVIIGKPFIKKLSDLKGKKVAMEKTSIGKYVLSRAIEMTDSLSQDDIEIVYSSLSNHFDIYQETNIDAVVTFEPTKSKLLKLGGVNLFDSSLIKNEILDLIVVKEKTLQKYPKEMQRFLNSWFKSIDYINANETQAVKKLAEYEEVSVEIYHQATAGLKILTLSENQELLCGDTPKILETFSKVENFLFVNKLINKPRKYNGTITANMLCN